MPFFYRAGRLLYYSLALLMTLGVGLLNWRLYDPPTAAYGSAAQVGPDVLPQLRFVREALDAGAGEQMQGFFPEGYFFSHALYGLAWADVGLRQPDGAPLRVQALTEARRALAALDSPAGRAPFASSLNPPYGVFYVGWTSRLRGAVLRLQPAEGRDPAELARFAADCDALAQAFAASPSPFLAAYPGQAWPVDSTVAVAALRLHDTILPPRYTATIAAWLTAAQARLDPATGLLPHRADLTTGQPLEGARGSSLSVMMRFLPEIDPAWGRGAVCGLSAAVRYDRGRAAGGARVSAGYRRDRGCGLGATAGRGEPVGQRGDAGGGVRAGRRGAGRSPASYRRGAGSAGQLGVHETLWAGAGAGGRCVPGLGQDGAPRRVPRRVPAAAAPCRVAAALARPGAGDSRAALAAALAAVGAHPREKAASFAEHLAPAGRQMVAHNAPITHGWPPNPTPAGGR